MKTIRTILLGLALTCGLSTVAFGATFVQTTPYFSAGDSPFNTAAPGYQIEDFEDLTLNTLGILSWSTSFGSGISTFSVDADDGVIDGSGAGGKSLSVVTSAGVTGLFINFDSVTFGQFPQDVGIVVTLASAFPLVIEAFDPLGFSLGTTTANLALSSPTGDDVFFGVTDVGGISKFHVYSNSAATFLHVDHLQYGPIPEPATMSLLALGGLALLRRKSKTP
ncbi:hypothetical protein LCGC14_0431690 [marine sediment metagenome]|uniref:Ice-binding protein C-terminal domain-containing protein n=1 Tax=marine sediment metagenome TaxID=412755 RepID=A0A0F9SU60_9ZZZZ|nr:PEP-CTERM sorting domain-containing protein [Phycisphaerae bacterium]HDZ42859.1 PEP-CTERM sorting domain-containing protein [Phycisphaerae bacterium]